MSKKQREAVTVVAKAEKRRAKAAGVTGFKGVSRAAVDRAKRGAAPKPIKHVAPMIMAGVVPEGRTAPVMALDSWDGGGGFDVMAYLNYSNPAHAVTFPGYPYLAQLATRAEYRNMADSLAVEMTREWIDFDSTIEGDESKILRIKQLEEEFKRLGMQDLFKRAVTHDAWFGRAQFFVQIKGHNRKRPLVLSNKTVAIGSLERVVTVEAMWTTPSDYNALDPAAPDFYKPIRWFMLGQEVHASRLLTVVSRPVSDMLKPSFNFSGLSLSQIAEPYVANWLKTRTAVGDIVTNFSLTALKTNMSQVLTSGDDGDSVYNRADMFTATKTNRGLMLIDKDDEELVQLNTPLGTLDALQAQSQEHMCSVSRIPAMILTGISPTGLNASSEGEIRAWYDWIRANQEAYWRDPLETIMKVVMLHLWGEIDDSIVVNFKPLHKLTPIEEAKRRLDDSTTATNYINAAVLDPSEVRQNLASDPLSGYSHIDPTEEVVPPVPQTGDMFGGDPADDQDDPAAPPPAAGAKKQQDEPVPA